MRATELAPGVTDAATARRWLLLAVSSLVLSGVLALALVIGRTPGLDRLISDPLLFRRALVVHVTLSLVVWFYAFAAALFSMLPVTKRESTLCRWSPGVGALSVATLVCAAAATGAAPVLSNYVPVIDHPLFLAGLVIFALALLCVFVSPRLLPQREAAFGPVPFPEAARPGIRVAAVSVLLAVQVVVMTALVVPPWLPAESRYEIIFWGGGHILQIASEAAMVAVWIILLTPALDREVLSRREASFVFGALLFCAALSPLFCFADPAGGTYRNGFTELMRWGIFPAVTVAFVLVVRTMVKAHREGSLPAGFFRDGRVLTFFASASLTALGFILGALIRGSNTMVPAHYHAAIGGVTASFMGVSYILFAPLGLRGPQGRLFRWSRWQPLLFGVGQSVFAVGFGLAGAHGMGRKSYGAEQLQRGFGETVGLLVMGAGGLVAVAGGLLFLAIAFNAWRRPDKAAALTGGTQWTVVPPTRHSNG